MLVPVLDRSLPARRYLRAPEPSPPHRWRWYRSCTLALALATVVVGAPRSARAVDQYSAAIRSVVESNSASSLRVRAAPELWNHMRPVYQRRAYAPLWVEGGRLTTQAQTVVDTIAAAQDEGLDPADYDAPRIAADAERCRAAGLTDALGLARFDVGLTAAAIRYIEDSFHGVINPQTAGLKLALATAPLDVDRVVVETATTDATATLRAMTPPFPAYRALKDALVHTRRMAAQSNFPTVPALPRLHPGDLDLDLPALRQFLTAVGDLPADAPPAADPLVYDDALVKAVTHFQHRHGLDEDGVLGASTLRQLRTPLSQRVTQLRLGLERLRWLPRTLPKRVIMVNLPEFRLRAYDGDVAHPALTMNVVVGSVTQKTETPLLSADMRYVIFRPRWNVPDSITQKEMLPTLRRNPRYFKKQNLELVGPDGMLLDPTEENFALLQAREARLRQKPGERNSLGLIKFVLPNRHDIYFHDTPNKSLFQRARRDFSHGCIRVADPVALAEFALTGVNGWTRDRIVQAMQNTDPKKMHVAVPLASPITVYVLYTTAVASDDGSVIFLDDIYGHDAKLAPLLRAQTTREAQTEKRSRGEDT